MPADSNGIVCHNYLIWKNGGTHTHTSNHTFLLVSCKHQTCFTRVGSEAESRRSLRSFTRVFFLNLVS